MSDQIFFIFFLFMYFSQYLYRNHAYPKMRKYLRPTLKNYMTKIPISIKNYPKVLTVCVEACAYPV